MKCEKYKEALIEAAAAGENLAGGLDDHVRSCPRCSERLRRERMLFTAIDEVLGPRVNAKPHPGFLASVRAEIAQADFLPRWRWNPRWNPIWALAGVVVALLVMLVTHQRVRRQTQPVGSQSSAVPTIRARQKTEFEQPGPSSTDNSNARNGLRQPRTTKVVGRRTVSREPQVLVPPDERIAFEQFVARLKRRDEVVQTSVSPAGEADNEPSPTPPINIARLQLEPLVWEEWK